MLFSIYSQIWKAEKLAAVMIDIEDTDVGILFEYVLS